MRARSDSWQFWSDSAMVSAAHRAGNAVLRRATPRRLRPAAVRAWTRLVHTGDRVECPICGSRFRHFQARWNAPDVICWRCGSQERHRALWLLLDCQRPDLLAGADSLLHFAPEPGLERLLRGRVGRYVSCDLDPSLGELELDIMDLTLEDGSFDATICAHVLEHVPDDRRALREVWRVLSPGGWAIVMVPLDATRERTLEDPTATDPARRRELFWQEDHVRLYGRDLRERLDAAGFTVEELRPSEALSPADAERFRLGDGPSVFVCWKRQ